MELDTPMLRLNAALRDVPIGRPFTLKIERHGGRYCMGLEGRLSCGLGFSVGMGWTVFVYSQIPRSWPQTPLNVLWMSTLLFPFGYWLRWRWTSLAGALGVVTALVAVAAMGDLTVPLADLGGVAAGILAGWLSSRGAQYLRGLAQH
jgi:hypothetical protein